MHPTAAGTGPAADKTPGSCNKRNHHEIVALIAGYQVFMSIWKNKRQASVVTWVSGICGPFIGLQVIDAESKSPPGFFYADEFSAPTVFFGFRRKERSGQALILLVQGGQNSIIRGEIRVPIRVHRSEHPIQGSMESTITGTSASSHPSSAFTRNGMLANVGVLTLCRSR